MWRSLHCVRRIHASALLLVGAPPWPFGGIIYLLALARDNFRALEPVTPFDVRASVVGLLLTLKQNGAVLNKDETTRTSLLFPTLSHVISAFYDSTVSFFQFPFLPLSHSPTQLTNTPLEQLSSVQVLSAGTIPF